METLLSELLLAIVIPFVGFLVSKIIIRYLTKWIAKEEFAEMTQMKKEIDKNLDVKQVIVMRKFSGLRTGKYCAQAAHASMGALLSIAHVDQKENIVIPPTDPAVVAWLTGRFTKVTLYVNTEAELRELHEKALAAKLPTALITDAGLTEFNGVPTVTAVAIGPGLVEDVNKITGNLPLF